LFGAHSGGSSEDDGAGGGGTIDALTIVIVVIVVVVNNTTNNKKKKVIVRRFNQLSRMCIVFFRLEFVASTSTYRLVLAANRDEFANRPTRELCVTSDTVIGGRDLVRGGMWIGTTSSVHSGRFACLTNVRVPMEALRTDARSRGAVASEFLHSQTPVDDYLRDLCASAAQFDPFCAVLGDVRSGELRFFTNHCVPARTESIVIGQLYCVTNDATLHSQWPKALRGIELFRQLTAPAGQRPEAIDVDGLFDTLLADTVSVDDDSLLPNTGFGVVGERLLSSIRVPIIAHAATGGHLYGTVSSVVTSISSSAGVELFIERSHRDGHPPQRTIRRAALSSLSKQLSPPPASAPTRQRTIIVGDVHGCATELEWLIDACDVVPGRDRVILLGDLVGKGPRDADVVRVARTNSWQCVLGNWDYHVLRVWRGEIPRSEASAEVGASFDALSEADFRYLDQLPYTISLPEFGVVCVHAGLRQGVDLERQVPFDMMNMRTVTASGAPSQAARGEGLSDWAESRTTAPHVVFGHDATRLLQERAFATGIDTGCVYGGQLTALILPDRLLVQVSAEKEHSKPEKK
jgi:uncharacterized protein with NRDE domain